MNLLLASSIDTAVESSKPALLALAVSHMNKHKRIHVNPAASAPVLTSVQGHHIVRLYFPGLSIIHTNSIICIYIKKKYICNSCAGVGHAWLEPSWQ